MIKDNLNYLETAAKDIENRGICSQDWERYLSARTREITDEIGRLQKFAYKKDGTVKILILAKCGEFSERVHLAWQKIETVTCK